MTGNRGTAPASGKDSALGSEKKFKKDEARDSSKDQKAKDEIGHMGEASEQNKKAKDVR